MDDEILLISSTYTQDPLGQQVPTEKKTPAFARIDSVSAQEFFEAGQAGLHAELRATLPKYDYSGQDTVEYQGTRYGVYRTYRGRGEEIELYLERKAGLTREVARGE